MGEQQTTGVKSNVCLFRVMLLSLVVMHDTKMTQNVCFEAAVRDISVFFHNTRASREQHTSSLMMSACVTGRVGWSLLISNSSPEIIISSHFTFSYNIILQ